MKVSTAKKINRIYQKTVNGWKFDDATNGIQFRYSSAFLRVGYFSGYPLKDIDNFLYDSFHKCKAKNPTNEICEYVPTHDVKMPSNKFMLPFGFFEALKDCLSLVNEDSPRNYGTVIKLHFKQEGTEGLTMVATDSFALLERKLYNYSEKEIEVCLGVKEAKLLCAVFSDGKQLARKINYCAVSDDKTCLYVSTGNTGTSDYAIACVRLSQVRYPKYTAIMPDRAPVQTFNPPSVMGLKGHYVAFGSEYMKDLSQNKDLKSFTVTQNIYSDIRLPEEITANRKYLKLADKMKGYYYGPNEPMSFEGKLSGNRRRLIVCPVTA